MFNAHESMIRGSLFESGWLPSAGSPSESDFRMLGVPSRATTKELSAAGGPEEVHAVVEFLRISGFKKVSFSDPWNCEFCSFFFG